MTWPKSTLNRTADRLSWDDTPEGERLRRYELTCKRAWQRTFELLLKIRQTGAELDLSVIPSIGRSLSLAISGRNRSPRTARRKRRDRTRASPSSSPIRRAKPIRHAKMRRTKPISMFRRPRSERPDGHKDFRIDAPHSDHKPGGIGKGGKVTGHSVLDRVLGGRKSTLMNLSADLRRALRAALQWSWAERSKSCQHRRFEISSVEWVYRDGPNFRYRIIGRNHVSPRHRHSVRNAVP